MLKDVKLFGCYIHMQEVQKLAMKLQVVVFGFASMTTNEVVKVATPNGPKHVASINTKNLVVLTVLVYYTKIQRVAYFKEEYLVDQKGQYCGVCIYDRRI